MKRGHGYSLVWLAHAPPCANDFLGCQESTELKATGQASFLRIMLGSRAAPYASSPQLNDGQTTLNDTGEGMSGNGVTISHVQCTLMERSSSSECLFPNDVSRKLSRGWEQRDLDPR